MIGVEFTDGEGRQAMLLTKGRYTGWLAFHNGSTWVVVRMAVKSDYDVLRKIRTVSVAEDTRRYVKARSS